MTTARIIPADEVEAVALEALHRSRARRREAAARRARRVEVLVAIAAGVLLALAVYMATGPVTDADAHVPHRAGGALAHAADYTGAGAPVEASDGLVRAAAYHGESKAGARVVYDQAELDAMTVYYTAKAREQDPAAPVYTVIGGAWLGGTAIVVGDFYRDSSPEFKCAILTHEYGHLLGLLDNVRYARDPLYVMGSAAITSQCAALIEGWQAAPAGDVAELERADRAAARDERLTLLYNARARRHNCMARANGKAHRRGRVKARARCRVSYRRTSAR